MMASNGNFKKIVQPGDLLTEEQQNILNNKGNRIEKIQSEIMSLSRPLLQSEAGWTKHVTPNTLALFQDEQSWSKVDAKLKSKEYKNINGPSWSSVKEDLNLDSEEGASHSESESSETTRFDAKDMEILGSMPMEEDTVVVKCNNCQRPLLPSRFKEHAEICLGDKLNQMKAFSENEDTNSEKTIKRKYPTDQAEDSTREDKKFKRQKRGSKEKAPLDLDRQCGVILGPSYIPCTRSITCKSHSMGAKRAVSGRSQAYDILLAAYQKKTIGRPTGQEPLPKKKVIINEAPIQTASTPVNPEKSLKHLKKLQSQVRLSALSSNESNIIRNRFQNNTASTIREEGYVDSDEEIESVMQAIQSIKPSPLAEKPYFFVKRRRQCFRIRNTLLDAITPKSSIAIDNPPLRHNHTLQNLRN